ncbi:MAG: HEAT repeat domain-containing protein [Gemmataceae bacterium]|nr:HEAT repeat domain-containing protein [Gemmataceae bacterium]
MALSITCPACQTSLSLDQSLAGKKVRCPRCQAVLDVPAAAGGGDENVWTALQAKPRLTPGNRVPREAPAEPVPAPRRRVASPLPVGWIIGGVAVGLGLIVGVCVLVLVLVHEEPPPPQPAAFVQMQGPGVNIKVELPNEFPQIVLPPEIVQNNPVPPVQPIVIPPPVVVQPPVKQPPVKQPPIVKQPPAKLEDPDPINRALAKVRAGSAFSQAEGSKELHKLEPVDKRRAEVVEALKRVANTPAGSAGRADAVRALARWGTKADVPFLIGLIDHQDRAVREAVITTLGEWKDPRAADPVAQRLVNGDDRPWASQALKEIGSSGEPPVIELLRHPDAGVRREACRVLRVIAGKAGHAALVEATDDPDAGVVQAAREALPAALRPPIYGPNQFIKLNVHVRNPKAWPEIEAKLKKLADAPKAILRASTSGDYKWVELAPVNTDAETFARRITFARIVAVHGKQRLIYIDPGK